MPPTLCNPYAGRGGGETVAFGMEKTHAEAAGLLRTDPTRVTHRPAPAPSHWRGRESPFEAAHSIRHGRCFLKATPSMGYGSPRGLFPLDTQQHAPLRPFFGVPRLAPGDGRGVGVWGSRRQESTPKPFAAQTKKAASARSRCHPRNGSFWPKKKKKKITALTDAAKYQRGGGGT